ncbi:MAG: PKD domain-containing protein [Pirellulales bacterium]
MYKPMWPWQKTRSRQVVQQKTQKRKGRRPRRFQLEYLEPRQMLTAGITITGSPQTDEGSLYTLNLAAQDITLSQWVIDWGDNTDHSILPGNSSSATHRYADGHNDYTINATATAGTDYYASAAIEVLNVAPTISLSGNTSAKEGSLYSFTIASEDAGTDAITGWQINWGDGAVTSSTASLANPVTVGHAYADDGTYTISATVTDEDGSYTLSPVGGTAGVLDPAFGTGGVQLTDVYNNTDWGDCGNSMALQSDGKIVVAGYVKNGNQRDTAVARYLPDGSIDSSFGHDPTRPGMAVISASAGNDFAQAVVIQPDGKIVVAGQMLNGSHYDFSVMRFDSDGGLDPGFAVATNGVATADFYGNSDMAFSVALDANGGIVAAGYAYDGTQYDFAVARFTPEGILDGTFDHDGRVTVDFKGSTEDPGAPKRSDYGRSVLIQPDGRILVGGFAKNAAGDNDFAMVRFDPSGQYDTTFNGDGNSDGKITTNVVSGCWDYIRSLALQGDRIIAGGYVWQSGNNYDFCVVRYEANGVRDMTFGPPNGNGKVTTNFFGQRDYIYNVLVQPDGAILAAGRAELSLNNQSTNNHVFALARYLPDGEPDYDFGEQGKTTLDLAHNSPGNPEYGEYVYHAQMQLDGKIVIVGSDVVSGQSKLARYSSGLPGYKVVVQNVPPALTLSGNLTTIADSIYTLTLRSADPGTDTISQWNVNWGDGTTEQFPGNSSSVTHVYSAPYGPYTVSATATDEEGSYTLSPVGGNAGLLDRAFGTGGVQLTDVYNNTDWGDCGNPMALQSDGKIVVAGYVKNGSQRDTAVARYLPDGTIDPSFGDDPANPGIAVISASTGDDFAQAVVIQPNGKIVVAGQTVNGSNCDFAVMRLDSDGTVDPAFAVETNGVATADFYGNSDMAFSVAIDPYGGIVAAGYAYDGTQYDFAVARFTSEGILDGTFDHDGKVTVDFKASTEDLNAPTRSDYARSVLIQPDGRILVGGFAKNAAGDNDFAMVRFKPDGHYDTTFHSDGKVTTDVMTGNWDYLRSLALQGDRIIAGGYVWQSANDYDFCVLRYEANGERDMSFGPPNGNGMATTDFFVGTDYVYNVLVQPDGAILAAGRAEQGITNNHLFALARYLPDGEPDLDFGTQGKTTLDLAHSSPGNPDYGEYVYHAQMQLDGKIAIVGSDVVSGQSKLARYSSGLPGYTVTVQNSAPASLGIADTSVWAGRVSSVVELWPAFEDGQDSAAALSYEVTDNSNPELVSSVAVDPATGRMTLNYGPFQ